jgi:hypothetical protein
MSGREQVDTATRGWCRHDLVSRCLFAGLLVLAYVGCAVNIASADVDMTGRLEKISSPLRSAPGEVKPLATSASGDYRCVDQYSVIANWYYYFAIGNCTAGKEIDVVSYASENSVTHEHSYGGFINGFFSGCGWIDTRFPLEKQNGNHNSACAEGSGGEFKVEESTFMERYNRVTVGDGNPVVNKTPCPEYANYRPWSSNNIEQELIRTAPAYAAASPGSNYPALKWRYTTKYVSQDGTGQYVMARDDRVTGAGEGNWVFVPRSCLPASLPESSEERLPPPPTVSTGGASSVEPQAATLHGTVNPNTVDARYHFEYWSTGSPVSTPEGDAGSGNTGVEESAFIGGLQPGTTYHYRLVATSAIGTGSGGEQAFTTPGPVEAATGTASGVTEVQATLTGTVNPRGYDAKYYFQYGETTGYGSATALSDAGENNGSVPVSALIIGLHPGTTYHYRLVATSGGITREGADQTLRTGILPTFYTSSANLTPEITTQFGNANNVPLAGDWFGQGKTTIGVYDPSSSTFYLDKSNTGALEVITTHFGEKGDIPLAGDWLGQGKDTIGVYRPSTATFYLARNNSGTGEVLIVPFGEKGDIPVTGDWFGQGKDTIGLFRPSNGTFYLDKSNTSNSEYISDKFGNPGDTPIAGDWTGKEGKETIGLYRPSTNTFYLNHSNTGELEVTSAQFGKEGDKPITGDWTGQGEDTIGIYREVIPLL